MMKWISSCHVVQIGLMEAEFNQYAERIAYYSLLLSFVFGIELLRMGCVLVIYTSIKCTKHPILMLCLRGKHFSNSARYSLFQIL